MLHRPSAAEPLHVMIATPSVAGQGGVDRVMATLQRGLERNGYANVQARFLPSRGSGSVLLSPFFMAAFCMRMAAARSRGKLNVVHINLASAGSTYRKLIIASSARLLSIPYVLHLHGAEYRAFWRQHGLLSGRIRIMFEHAAEIVVLGRVWRDFILSRAPKTGGKITIIPNATEAPQLQQRGGGDMVHVLFLGRIGDRKGVPQLGEALHNMRGLPGWRATIAGDGAVKAARAKAVELGLQDRVSIPGWVGPEAVAELIASADVLVLPSFAENLPVSVIEGMAAGLAVVATPVGAVEDIVIDEHSGLLVPPGDVQALTKALTRLVEDSELRGRLGANARAIHRERLDLAPFCEAIRSVWLSAAHKSRLPTD